MLSAKPNRIAMYATVSSATLMLAASFATQAAAVDQVVDQGTTVPAGIVLADGDSLTNNGTITNNVFWAVASGADVVFILNSATGEIEATGAGAIGIAGSLGTFTNHGLIAADGQAALFVGGDLGRFVNTGTMSNSDGGGFNTNGNVGTFNNSGSISATGDAAVRVQGTTGTFTNSGTLTSNAAWTTIYFNDELNQFSNSGTIVNTGTGKAFEFDLNNGAIGSFTNSGTIAAIGEQGVGIFGNAHRVGTFTNSGTIEGGSWEAVHIGGGVDRFVNTSTGVIRNVGRGGANDGHGVAFNIDTIDGGSVGIFENHGKIIGDLTGGEGSGVGFFDNGNDVHQVGTFINTGTITGFGNGVSAQGGFGAFNNSGTITSQIYQSFRAGGDVGTFTNSGTIHSEQDHAASFEGLVGSFSNSGKLVSDQRRGVEFIGRVDSFTNSGTIDSLENGVTFDDGFGSALNSGTILSRAAAGQMAVRVDGGTTGTFTNRGTIDGSVGVEYDNGADSTLVNSGTIRGTDGDAIRFSNGDDLLKLETGSRIFGAVAFNAGDDTLDFADFAGNALLTVYDLDNVVAGTRMYYFDQPNDQLAIVETTGVTQGSQPAISGLALQVVDLLPQVLDGALSGPGDIAPLGYMPAPQTAADLAIVPQQPAQATVWATAIGGGSHDAAPVNVNSLYGALVAGTHAMLAPDTTLGVMGGIGSGRVDTNNGGQTVDSTAGIAGVYGRHDAGVVSIDFSLLGGVVGNDSAREVITPGGIETATASYGSWFIAPSLGVAIPVLDLETGEVDLVGSVSYIGGQASGYTEAGSSMNLTVGQQAISLLDARLGLAGTFDVGSDGAKVTTRGGVFAQSNLGGTTVPVSFLGQTQNAAVAGTTDFGLYGGVGFSAPVGQMTFSANADAQWRFDGQVSGAVRLGAKAGF